MQYQGIAHRLAVEYLPLTGNDADFDDLMQAGHIGAMRAAETYDPNKGSWYNWCSYYMRNEMRVVCGIGSSKRDASQFADSMDAPITEDGITVADTLAADTADPQDGLDMLELVESVRECVEALRLDRRWVIELVDLEGKSPQEAAEELGTTIGHVISARRAGYDCLRRDANILRLADAYGLLQSRKDPFGVKGSNPTERGAFFLIQRSEKNGFRF